MSNENIITLTIHDVAFGGDGVGRWENKVVFVPQTLPGESVRARLTEEKKNYARAELLEVLHPSTDRQSSPCPFFGPCPGCRYLHVRYDTQLELKSKQVVDLLTRIGKLKNLPPIQIIPSSSPLEYRNKIKMHVAKTANSCKVGFIGDDNKTLVDIERCLIAWPQINDALKKFRGEVAQKPGSFRGIWLARADAKGNLRDFFFEEGKEKLEELPLLKEEVQGKPFLSPFESFFQTNPAMLEKWVGTVEGMLSLTQNSVWIDAYCGVGIFTLLFAPKAREAVGIEEDHRAIGCARQNAKILFVKNAQFVAAKVEKVLENIFKEHAGKELRVLLDPPRVGCHPQVLEVLKKQKVPQIIYVSCNPATLARDLGQLCPQHYRLQSLALVDMFPQTAHCEVVSRLEVCD